ncbi:plasminogen-binding N-terminal domain-containing protein [Helicobacter bizzozeronii]|uniref:plasminogen-binding N-terminal domain-containing protein n=1 Tax=Helicobacter bizzozeronii TaxID=56877 RepID=UPI000CF09930|nr:plasminogen-binding N-terminal domain-containing protein [Helicobacter bizzozeronii]
MLKRWCLGFLGFSLAFLHGIAWNETLKINIDAVDTHKKIVRFQAYNLKVGETGYILAKLTDYNVIAAKVEVVNIRDGVAFGKYGEYSVMKQRHLPTPRMVPKKGYMAIFREFNHQAFLVAPDSHLYEQVKDSYPDITFISSDLLMVFFNGFDPSARSFRRACDIYSAGLLFLVSTDRLNILDCQSFAVLESQKLDTSKVRRTSAPFFSRVEGVDRGTLGKVLSGGKSKNYFSFYDNLLKKEAQKRLEHAVKAEQRREYEMEIREAKSAQEKKSLKEQYKEEKKEDKENITPKLSKQEKAEEKSLDQVGAQERAKEDLEDKREYQEQLAKQKAEQKAQREAKKKAKKEAKKKLKQERRLEKERGDQNP